MAIFVLWFLPAIGSVFKGVAWIVGFLPRLGAIGQWIMRIMPWFHKAFQWVFSSKGAFAFIVVWIGTWFVGLGDQFTEMVVWLLTEVGKILFEFIFEDEDSFLWWVFGQGLDFFAWFVDKSGLDTLLENLYSQHGAAIDFSMELIGRMNQFFPVVETGALMAVYTVFMVFFLIFKFVLKLISGIG